MGASNNMRGSFEEQWSSAFEKAEITPSDQLWTNIDGALANAQAGKYRRGVIFYRLLAAASILIAIGLGMVLFFQSNVTNTDRTLSSIQKNNTEDRITENGDTTESAKPTNIISSPDQVASSKNQNVITPKDVLKSSSNNTSNEADFNESLIAAVSDENRSQAYQSDDQLNNMDKTMHSEYDADRIVFNSEIESKGIQPKSTSINTDIHMYNVPLIVVKKPKIDHNQLWAGLGLSSGSFNPNINEGSLSVQESADSFQSDEESALRNAVNNSSETYDPGFSYSIAANAGWKFAPRWVLQGGLQYQLSRSGTQASQFIQNKGTRENFAPASLGLEDVALNADDFEVVNNDINLTNNFQFLSIPIKVSYLIIDKKVQLGVNTGISTDFFLKNKVTESDNLVESFEQTPGNDSPYNKTFLSGLFGVELGYNFLDNYFFTLEPSYKRSFNSFTKESTNLSSNPSRLGLTLGFKYIFK